jgi:hypothetical protein
MSSRDDPTSDLVGDPNPPRRSSPAAATPFVAACVRSCEGDEDCDADDVESWRRLY